jgi:hypothetical protein
MQCSLRRPRSEGSNKESDGNMTVVKACRQSDRGSNDTSGMVWARVTRGNKYKHLQVAKLTNTRMLLLSVIRAALISR